MHNQKTAKDHQVCVKTDKGCETKQPCWTQHIYPSCRAKSKAVQGVHRKSYPGSSSWNRGSCSPASHPGTTIRYSLKGLQSCGWQEPSSDALPASHRPWSIAHALPSALAGPSPAGDGAPPPGPGSPEQQQTLCPRAGGERCRG